MSKEVFFAKYLQFNICITLCHILIVFHIIYTNKIQYVRGDCGSCTVSVGGSRIKACVGKVPPMPKLKSLQEKGLVVK